MFNKEDIENSIKNVQQKIINLQDEELDNFFLMYPHCKNIVLENILFGLVVIKYDEKIKPQKFKTTIHNLKNEEWKEVYAQIQINLGDIKKLDAYLMNLLNLEKSAIFNNDLAKKLKKETIVFYLNYETYDVEVEVKKSIGFMSENENESQESICNEFEEWGIRAFLPDYETVFKEFLSINNNDWIWEYVDKYNSAVSKIYEDLKYQNPLAQIGGYGYFIQGSLQEDFIAQYDSNVGDAGQTYLTFINDEYHGEVQMY